MKTPSTVRSSTASPIAVARWRPSTGKKVRNGVWNRNATESFVPEDHQKNLLLTDLSADQRLVLAKMSADAYDTGSFDVLVALYEEEVRPFDKGYEGDPFHDFIGRMADWEWPESGERV